MRYLPLLIIAATICCCTYSCKKDNSTPPVPPTSPTSDYRSQYTGEFKVYCKSLYVVHRSNMGGQRDSTASSSTDDVTVSYNILDSIDYMSPVASECGKYPAITFTYSGGSKVQYGIQTDGYMRLKYQSGGWFYNADSFRISSGTYATNYTSISNVVGKRK